MKAEELEDFIVLLGRIRMDMLPLADTGDLEQGSRVEVASQSRWYVDPRDNGSALIAVFHPAYRWVGTVVAAPDLERFIETAQKARLPR